MSIKIKELEKLDPKPRGWMGRNASSKRKFDGAEHNKR